MLQRLRAFVSTLQLRILAIAALCWLLPTLTLGTYLGGVFFSALRTQTEAALTSSAVHAQSLAAAQVDQLIALAKRVTYDNELEKAVTRYRAGDDAYSTFYMRCRQYMDVRFIREGMVTAAAFYLTDDVERPMHKTGDDADAQARMQRALPLLLESAQSLDTRCCFVQAGDDAYLVRNLFDKRLERFGLLVLGVDVARLLAPLAHNAAQWEGQLDAQLDGCVLSDGGAPLPDAPDGLREENGSVVYRARVGADDYTLAYRLAVDKHALYAQGEHFNRLMKGLLVLLAPVELLILLFVYRRLTNPLNKLALASARMERGELGVTVPMHGADEIGRVGRAFNAMSLRIRELIDKSYRAEIVLRDARIEAMQSRINPHFLNNSLELLNWQARMEGSEPMTRMIDALSILLNAGLDRSNRRVVPLREELEVAGAYFYFLEQRFGARLQISREVDEALLDVCVPRLCVQTLLENAVEHGIAPVGGGKIALRVFASAGFLVLDVQNNGKPVTPQDLARISSLLADDDKNPHSEHLGIRNVHLRLRLIYDERAGLTIERAGNGKTCARIRVPLDAPAANSAKLDNEQQESTTNPPDNRG